MSLKRPLDDLTNNYDDQATYVLDNKINKKVRSSIEPEEKANQANRIQVFVRIRPENEKEFNSKNVKRIIDVLDDQNLIFDPKEDIGNTYYYHGKLFKEIGKKPKKNLQFKFDKIFDENSTNYNVFESTTKNLISSFLNGYNCTIFAYGSTGSGKTHTIIGDENNPGIIYLTVLDLFNQIKQNNELEISVSYIEIYNENVYDLLSPKGKPLAVREDAKKGVVVANLSVHHPENAKDLITMVKIGNNNRAKQATDANSQSSRSHAIFQINLEKHDYSSNHQMSMQLSKMSLIDLAGSERASVAYKEKRTKCLQREGSNINKSLLSLGNCINALANQNSKKASYVPYRNSKLTLLLRDSLSGKCKTVMIAAVSPTSYCFEDTHNSLAYASRAKGIQFEFKPSNAPQSTLKSYSESHLLNEIKSLKLEILKLKQKTAKKEEGHLDVHTKNILEKLFNEKIKLRKAYLECFSSMKKVECKLIFKKCDMKRLKTIDGQNDHNVLTKELNLENQLNYFNKLKNELEINISRNQDSLEEIISKLKNELNDHSELNLLLTRKLNECEVKELVFIQNYSNELTDEFVHRFENNEDLVMHAVKLLQNCYQLLSNNNLIDTDLQSKFNNIKKSLELKKKISWKDPLIENKQNFN